MARSRNIKPSFFTNADLADCSLAARLLFIGLWTEADREGRLFYRPRELKAKLLPYDAYDVNHLVGELVEKGFVERYEAEGRECLWVINFRKHQNPHKKEPPSQVPEFKGVAYKHGAYTVQAPDEHHTGPADSLLLIPDSPSLIPDSRVTPSATEGDYAFTGRNFKIKRSDFHQWEKIFKTVDVLVELKNLDDWYDRQIAKGEYTPDRIRKSYFWQVSQALAKKDLERKTASGGASL